MKISHFILCLFIILIMQNAKAFNYQGELSQAGDLYTGTADLNFKLFDAETIGAGTQIGLEDLHSNISVVNGRFVVELNQWIGLFDGNDYWLEISASIPASSGSFTTLSPRQMIAPVPYSEYTYDLDTSGLQARVTGSCGADSAMVLINQDGTVSCAPLETNHTHEFSELTSIPAGLADGDDDTTYSGSDFVVSNQTCGAGQTVTGMASNGVVICSALVPAPPNCDQVNEALQYNSGTGWACVDVSTIGASTGNASGYETIDSWGLTFDGKERIAATWADANQNCENLGGRLPTISELYRVSGAFKGEVASSYETNYLWARTWWDKVNKSMVRLTDGFTISSSVNSLRSYRCVWPTATPDYFAGNQCMGEPGSGCWDHVGHPTGKMAMDMMDRPALPLVAATDECSFVNAHIAHQQDYAENIKNNLPNGTNAWLWTSDQSRYDYNNIIRWLDTDPLYDDYTNVGVSVRTNLRNFRCSGVSYAAGEHPTTVANEFVASDTKIKADSGVTTSALYGDSIDGCFVAGGHMAHSRDIMELARAGMGNGPGADYIWLADRSRFDLTQITRWTGIDSSYTGYFSEYTNWSNVDATAMHQHRCAYYPIDSAYSHPLNAQCSADVACTVLDNGASKLAIDTLDRPALIYIEAIQACLNEGGRLATSLQLTEAIRAGLANGSDNFLFTADSGYNNTSTFATTLKWTGTETDFSPIYQDSATLAQKSVPFSFRCAWTNELW